MFLNQTTRLRENEDGSGAGAPGANGEQKTDATEVENKTEDNLGIFDKTWEDEEVKNENDGQSAVATTTQTTEAAKNPDEILNEHIKGLNLADGIDMQKLQTDLATGSTESLQAALTQVAGNAYRASMLNSTKIMDAKIDAAIASAVNQSEGKFKTADAIRQLHAALPFTAQPAIAPVAKGVFGQYIKKGSSIEDAIKQTQNYFRETAKLSAKDVGLHTVSKDSHRSGPGGIELPDDDTEDQSDWMKILSGKT